MKFPIITFLLSSLLPHSLSAAEPDPKLLEFTKWTPNFQVPDPVAISFDEKGRAYVTQTQRRKANDLDIRNNRDWIPKDLSFQSPDDKRAFYRKTFTPENSNANKRRVKDDNKDGVHDLLDLQVLSERIHLIEDTTGDGFADKTSVYAENFRDEIAGIAAGVLHHNGDVYTTIVPDLWKLRDTDDDGKADTRESIAYGFGAHLAYAGHDMHGLTVGPAGRIYWTVGDKGLNVKSKEGHHFKYPNQGAVLRCDPDGSHFEVYARGLRNVQELAFDQYGNLFGIDNDSDRPGEKERFIYIVQHMDAGWRSNWQYRKGEFNPWMDENLSVPYQKNQPAYITPPISLYNNGPAGLAFNPGTALSEEWQNYFFHTSAPNGQQWAFQVEQDGASFKMVNDIQIGNGVPIVGINFGPDGALYGVDWGGGYPLNQKGAIWKWDVKNKHPLRKQTTEILRADFTKYRTRTIGPKLQHPDQRVRLKAQFELVRRQAKTELITAARTYNRIGKIHAIWGLGQLERRLTKPSFDHLLPFLKDLDPEIITQTAKIIGEQFPPNLSRHKANGPRSEHHSLVSFLVPLLEHHWDRVKFHAAIALGNIGASEAAEPIIEMLRSNKDHSKTYLRHAAIVGLTGCATSQFLASLYSETNFREPRIIQKAAVVALRRRADPKIALFLGPGYGEVEAEAARAIHDDWMIPSALPALAESLVNSTSILNPSLTRRSINANFHLGTLEHAQRVAKYSTILPEALRLDALNALSNWTKPAPLDRVVGRYRPLKPRDPAIAKTAVSEQLATLLTDPSQKVQTRAMSLARSLKIEIPTDSLILIAHNENSPADLRIESLRSIASQKHPRLDSILAPSLTSKNDQVRIAALQLLAKSNAQAALSTIEKTLTKETATTQEKQAALKLLSLTPESKKGDQILQSLLANFESVPSSIQLDLFEAAATRKLKAPAPDFSHTLTGGDAVKGKDLFMNHLAAQCIRCHKVSEGKGSDIGPNLKSIGLQNRTHLLESIIEPQKIITKGYGAISLTLKNGKSVSGLFQSEKNNLIQIRVAEGPITKIKSSDVKERSPVISTMPPMGLILKKREIRDIIEYLSTLKSPSNK